MSAGVRIRRVGFRTGTDAELTALHAVEAPVDAERRNLLAEQPLESYIAFARSLPSVFDDHAWLAETADGTPVASGFCWSNSAADARVMESDLFVRHDRRREGIGSRLLAAIAEETARDGRASLTWRTFDSVPAGEAFSRRHGARIGRVNRTSEQVLAEVDWVMVGEWAAAERGRALGYRTEVIEGVFPEHLRDDAATLHHLVQAAPRDDLDVVDIMIDAAFVAELDRNLVDSGRTRWTILVRDPDGVCVGGTEVHLEPWEPAIVLQQNTAIDPAHRGLGLAKWVKAEMLELIRERRPQAERIRTDNAFSNDAMLGINNALGFRVVSTRTEWQVEVDALRRVISA